MAGLRIGAKFSGDVPVAETLDLAVMAERLGYSSLWVNETRFTRDAVTRISAIAAATTTAALGTAVLNPYTRSLMLLTITAATIDEISKGRFILGMGVGTKRYLSSEGIIRSHPLIRLEEYVLLMRRLWNGETVSFNGKALEVSQVKLDFKPFRNNIPIYIGATEERGLRFAANIANGIILNGYTPKSHAMSVKEIVGSNSKVSVLGNVMVSMDQDEEKAIEGARLLAYTYLTSIPTIANANAISHDFIEELKALEKKQGASTAMIHLPDRMIKNAVAVGTPEQCKKWILDYSQSGPDEVLVTRIHGNTRQIIHQVAELFTI